MHRWELKLALLFELDVPILKRDIVAFCSDCKGCTYQSRTKRKWLQRSNLRDREYWKYNNYWNSTYWSRWLTWKQLEMEEVLTINEVFLDKNCLLKLQMLRDDFSFLCILDRQNRLDWWQYLKCRKARESWRVLQV